MTDRLQVKVAVRWWFFPVMYAVLLVAWVTGCRIPKPFIDWLCRSAVYARLIRIRAEVAA